MVGYIAPPAPLLLMLLIRYVPFKIISYWRTVQVFDFLLYEKEAALNTRTFGYPAGSSKCAMMKFSTRDGYWSWFSSC